MTKYKYAVLDGDAVLLGEHEAWTYYAARGSKMSNVDAFSYALSSRPRCSGQCSARLKTSCRTAPFPIARPWPQ